MLFQAEHDIRIWKAMTSLWAGRQYVGFWDYTEEFQLTYSGVPSLILRYLTNDGIEHLRTYLNLPSEIVPATLKKSARPPSRPMGGAGGDRPPRGPPREGERPRFGGDREGYRSNTGRGDGPGGFGGEKGGAPGEYRPEFRGGRGGGFGRGAGSMGGGAPGAITE